MVEIGPIADVGVLGGGTAFPPNRLSNTDVLARLPGGAGRSAEQLAFAASGIRQTLGLCWRSWAHDVGSPLDHAREPTTVDLAVEAGRAALADAGIGAEALAMVLCATSTPHRMTSTVSAAVGAALGATAAACMDTRAGCSAGLFGLATAALHVSAGTGPVLLIGTETFSKIIPPAHQMAALSLGDGAGALVLGPKPGAAIDAVYLRTDGRLGRLITTDGALPPTEAELSRGGYVLSGTPEELVSALPERYLEAIGAVLARGALTAARVDFYVPHQTTTSLIGAVAGAAGLDAARTWRAGVERHANIGAAGWIAGLVEARTAGHCPTGARVLVAAVGGGMSWAAALLTC